LLVLPRLHPPRQPLATLVDTDTRRLVSTDLDAAKAGVVERLGGHDDERRGIAVGRQRDLALFPQLREAVAPRLLQAGQEELARRLLDERAGAAAARRLHEDLLRPAGRVRRQEDRLHVLAADLGDEAHVGVQTLDASGHRDDLLDELAANQRSQAAGARAREEDAVARRKAGFRLHPTEELQHLLALSGVVALVVLPERLAVLDEDGLARGRADVDPGELHDVRPSARATCMTMFAPVPATVPLWGTRYVARFMS